MAPIEPTPTQFPPRTRPLAIAGTIACALLLATALTRPAGAAIINVGSGGPAGGCDTNSIGGALLQAATTSADDEIRLARSLTYANEYLQLTNWDSVQGALTIRGGFDTCSDTTPSGRTTVGGRSGSPTVEIDTTATDRTSSVLLKDLVITGSGQRGILVMARSTLAMENVLVEGNEGGVFVDSGGELTMDTPSWIRQNDAGASSYGGGIRCRQATMTLEGPISGNSATNGGGLYADDCSVTLRDGAWIQGNTADYGGGLHLEGGTFLAAYDPQDHYGMLVNDNDASEWGGGIYAAGEGTYAELHGVRVTLNTAQNYGGGVAVLAGADLVMQSTNSFLGGNALTTGSSGSAAHVGAGSFLGIYNTRIEGNSGPGDTGILLHASGTGANLSLTGDWVWSNGATVILRADTNATMNAGYVTIAGNSGPSSSSDVVHAAGGAVVDLHSTLLWNGGGYSAGSGATIVGDCVVADTLSGLSATRSLVVADPGFQDLVNGDLHLRPSSPAVDYCDDTSPYSTDDVDVEYHGRDLLSRPDVYGPFDVGADEVHPIFTDGFESGNTLFWSATVP